ncbi:MAG: protein-export chaperone SecB [Nitrospirales bacterium]
MIAALQLNNFFTESFSIGTNSYYVPGVTEDRVAGKINSSLEIAIPEKEGKYPYRVSLTVSIEPAQEKPALDPYAIKFKIIGFFTLSGNPSSDQKERMLNLNGGAMLYGILRGFVAQTTGSATFGKYILPAINFVDIYEKNAHQRALENEPELKKKSSTRKRRSPNKRRVKS